MTTRAKFDPLDEDFDEENNYLNNIESMREYYKDTTTSLKLIRITKDMISILTDFTYRLQYTTTKIIDDMSEEKFGDRFAVYSFEQMWPNTACGFSDVAVVAGQAFTKSMTYVVIPNARYGSTCYVYFDGKFGYCAEYSRVFMEDVNREYVESVGGKDKYKIS